MDIRDVYTVEEQKRAGMCFSLNKEMSYFYPDLLPRFCSLENSAFYTITVVLVLHIRNCFSPPNALLTKKFIPD